MNIDFEVKYNEIYDDWSIMTTTNWCDELLDFHRAIRYNKHLAHLYFRSYKNEQYAIDAMNYLIKELP